MTPRPISIYLWVFIFIKKPFFHKESFIKETAIFSFGAI